jgi:hypothetical protein
MPNKLPNVACLACNEPPKAGGYINFSLTGLITKTYSGKDKDGGDNQQENQESTKSDSKAKTMTPTHPISPFSANSVSLYSSPSCLVTTNVPI